MPLDKLTSKVETLTTECAMKENQGEAMKRFGIVMDKIQGLEERVGLVEKALFVQHPDGHTLPFSQVGNTITTILKELKDATAEIKLKANIVHLNAVQNTFEISAIVVNFLVSQRILLRWYICTPLTYLDPKSYQMVIGNVDAC